MMESVTTTFCLSTYLSMHVCICICLYLHTCIYRIYGMFHDRYPSMYVCMYVCMCVCTCMCLCMCTYRALIHHPSPEQTLWSQWRRPDQLRSQPMQFLPPKESRLREREREREGERKRKRGRKGERKKEREVEREWAPQFWHNVYSISISSNARIPEASHV